MSIRAYTSIAESYNVNNYFDISDDNYNKIRFSIKDKILYITSYDVALGTWLPASVVFDNVGSLQSTSLMDFQDLIFSNNVRIQLDANVEANGSEILMYQNIGSYNYIKRTGLNYAIQSSPYIPSVNNDDRLVIYKLDSNGKPQLTLSPVSTNDFASTFVTLANDQTINSIKTFNAGKLLLGGNGGNVTLNGSQTVSSSPYTLEWPTAAPSGTLNVLTTSGSSPYSKYTWTNLSNYILASAIDQVSALNTTGSPSFANMTITSGGALNLNYMSAPASSDVLATINTNKQLTNSGTALSNLCTLGTAQIFSADKTFNYTAGKIKLSNYSTDNTTTNNVLVVNSSGYIVPCNKLYSDISPFSPATSYTFTAAQTFSATSNPLVINNLSAAASTDNILSISTGGNVTNTGLLFSEMSPLKPSPIPIYQFNFENNATYSNISAASDNITNTGSNTQFSSSIYKYDAYSKYAYSNGIILDFSTNTGGVSGASINNATGSSYNMSFWFYYIDDATTSGAFITHNFHTNRTSGANFGGSITVEFGAGIGVYLNNLGLGISDLGASTHFGVSGNRNKWWFYSLSWNADTNKFVFLLTDGTDANTSTSSQTITTPSTITTLNSIARAHKKITINAGGSLYIDDLRIYNIALSTQQLSSIYKATSSSITNLVFDSSAQTISGAKTFNQDKLLIPALTATASGTYVLTKNASTGAVEYASSVAWNNIDLINSAQTITAVKTYDYTTAKIALTNTTNDTTSTNKILMLNSSGYIVPSNKLYSDITPLSTSTPYTFTATQTFSATSNPIVINNLTISATTASDMLLAIDTSGNVKNTQVKYSQLSPLYSNSMTTPIYQFKFEQNLDSAGSSSYSGTTGFSTYNASGKYGYSVVPLGGYMTSAFTGINSSEGTSLTVTGWFFLPTGSSGGLRVYLEKLSPIQPTSGHTVLIIGENVGYGTAFTMYYNELSGASNVNVNLASTPDLSAAGSKDKWWFFAYKWDHTINTQTVYISDGTVGNTFKNTMLISDATAIASINNLTRNILNVNFRESGSTTRLDDFRMYNVALLDSELDLISKATSSTVSIANLVLDNTDQTIIGNKTYSGIQLFNSGKLALTGNGGNLTLNASQTVSSAAYTLEYPTAAPTGVLNILTTSGSTPYSKYTWTDLSTYLTSATAASTYLTSATATSTYLTSATATSTYLTQTNAGTTYLTQTNAGTTYLTQTNAGTTYLTQTNAGTTYMKLNATQTNLGINTWSGNNTFNQDKLLLPTLTSTASGTYVLTKNASTGAVEYAASIAWNNIDLINSAQTITAVKTYDYTTAKIALTNTTNDTTTTNKLLVLNASNQIVPCDKTYASIGAGGGSTIYNGYAAIPTSSGNRQTTISVTNSLATTAVTVTANISKTTNSDGNIVSFNSILSTITSSTITYYITAASDWVVDNNNIYTLFYTVVPYPSSNPTYSVGTAIIPNLYGYTNFETGTATDAYSKFTFSDLNANSTVTTASKKWGSYGLQMGNGYGVSMNGTNYTSLNGNFTLAFWYRTPSTANPPDLQMNFGVGANTNLVGVSQSTTPATMKFTTWGGYTVPSPASVSLDTNFHHYTIVINTSASTCQFYMDGTLLINMPSSNLATGAVGTYLSWYMYSSFFPVIDDLRMYNRCLSSSEAGLLATVDPLLILLAGYSSVGIANLLCYWNFNSSVYCGISNITFSGTPTYNTSTYKFGTAAINRTSATLTANGSSFAALTGVTISFWANYFTNALLTLNPAALTELNINTTNNTGSTIQVGLSGGTLAAAQYSSAVSYSTSNWYHITIYIDLLQKVIKLYLNGSAILTYVGSDSYFAAASWTAPVISINKNGSANIDDLRVYNRLLSDTEINYLYCYTPTSIYVPSQFSSSAANTYTATQTFSASSTPLAITNLSTAATTDKLVAVNTSSGAVTNTGVAFSELANSTPLSAPVYQFILNGSIVSTGTTTSYTTTGSYSTYVANTNFGTSSAQSNTVTAKGLSSPLTALNSSAGNNISITGRIMFTGGSSCQFYQYTTTPGGSFDIRFRTYNDGSDYSTLFFSALSGGGSDNDVNITTANFNMFSYRNKWVLFVLTLEPTTNTLVMYLTDGSAIASTSKVISTATSATAITDIKNAMRSISSANMTPSGTAFYLSDIRYYNITLTQTEILAIAAASSTSYTGNLGGSILYSNTAQTISSAKTFQADKLILNPITAAAATTNKILTLNQTSKVVEETNIAVSTLRVSGPRPTGAREGTATAYANSATTISFATSNDGVAGVSYSQTDTGITYNAGIFTNTSGQTRTYSINFKVGFPSTATSVYKSIWISYNGGVTANSISQVQYNTTADMLISTNANITLANGAYFDCRVYTSSPSDLSIGVVAVQYTLL